MSDASDLTTHLRAVTESVDALRVAYGRELARSATLERELSALREQKEGGGKALVTCEMCKRDDEFVSARSTYAGSRYWIRACAKCFDALRASPSPSAGAVPEVKTRHAGAYAQLYVQGYCLVSMSDRDNVNAHDDVERAALNLRKWLAENMPHADAGGAARGAPCWPKRRRGRGEVERLRAECVGLREMVSARDANLTKALEEIAKLRASAEAARREVDAEWQREIAAEAAEWSGLPSVAIGNCQLRMQRIRARVAEREKTDDKRRIEGEEPKHLGSDASSGAGDEVPRVRTEERDAQSRDPGRAPDRESVPLLRSGAGVDVVTEGATPAPCPVCDGRGIVKRLAPEQEGAHTGVFIGQPCRCYACGGTGRAPASSPAPAAPEARGEEDDPVDDALLEWWRDMAGDPCWADIVSFVRAERARARDAALEEAARECLGCRTDPSCVHRVRALRGKAESGEGGASDG